MNRKQVFNELKQDEGVEYKVYLDHLGYPTFGVGHLIKETDPEHGSDVGTRVSDQRVEQAFGDDLDAAIDDCNILYSSAAKGYAFENLPEEVQHILVNMMFNMGRTRLSKFRKMNAAVLKGDWKTASIEGRDSQWYEQVTNRAERLMTRMERV